MILTACGREVQQGWLSSLESVHNDDGCHKPQNIRHENGNEIRLDVSVSFRWRRFRISLKPSLNVVRIVVSQCQGDEHSGEDTVARLSGCSKRLWRTYISPRPSIVNPADQSEMSRGAKTYGP